MFANMSGKRIHKRRDIVQISFPNNRRSTRFPRRKVVTKRVWKEEESSAYFGVPASAIFTPFDIPNPTDNAPSFSHTIHYSDVGGYAPAPILGFRAFATTSREVYGGLSPTSNDTDGDGLYDGPNVDYTYTLDRKNHRGENYTTAYLGKDATYTGDPYKIWNDTNNNGMIDAGEPWNACNPLNPDTDGDSANDGQEAVSGYDLIWMLTRGEGVQDTKISILPNPALALDPYNRDTNGKPRDIDGDGIGDWDESNPTVNYAWYTSTHNETEISNQFNPFVKENIPPMIEWVDIDTKEAWEWGWVNYVYIWHCEHAWAIIDVYVTDVAPYTITIGVTDRNRYNTTIGQGGQYMEKHHAVIEIDYWTDVACDYTVNVTITDTAQNVAYFEKKINGWFGGALDFLADIWNAMAGCFEAAWEAVKNAVNWIFNWVKTMIQGIVDYLLTPVVTSIRNYLDGIMKSFDALIFSIEGTGSNKGIGETISQDLSLSGISDWIKTGTIGEKISALMLLIAVVYIGLRAGLTIVAPFMAIPGVGGWIEVTLSTLVIAALIGALATFGGGGALLTAATTGDWDFAKAEMATMLETAGFTAKLVVTATTLFVATTMFCAVFSVGAILLWPILQLTFIITSILINALYSNIVARSVALGLALAAAGLTVYEFMAYGAPEGIVGILRIALLALGIGLSVYNFVVYLAKP